MSARKALLLFAVASCALLPRTAEAITQPGTNTVIPTDLEVRDALTHLGETLDPTVDGATTPERFKPLCTLTFTVLERLTDFKNSFGWYNVTGKKPATDELYELIHCSDPPNTWDATYANQTSRVLDIKNDPRYLGGEIGFFQAVPTQSGNRCADVADATTVSHVVYSEPALNPDSGANALIHLLIMNSTQQNNVFYFAWEDLLQGGDNDFSDLLLKVEGVNCSGGGEPCETDLEGVCKDGATRCDAGKIVCMPRQVAGDERCNGLDDDCDGTVDNGDLCEVNQICDRGRCIDACNTGEFRCPVGLLCRAGYCVDPACAEVDCEVGKVCVSGECVDPCSGVVCPFAQECRGGRCVDPCAGIECAEDQACIKGACVTTCECGGCSTDTKCNRERKVCEADACMAVTCGTGTHCVAGDCVDDCTGAVCPPGQTCTMGACVGDVLAPGEGTGGTGGTPPIDIDLGGKSGSGTPSAGGSDGGNSLNANKRSVGDPGCACHVPPPAGSRAGWIAAASLLLLGSRRRRGR